MICKNCQTENVEDAVFCKHCGKRLDGSVICPACGKQSPDDALFCSSCGKSLCTMPTAYPKAMASSLPADDKAEHPVFRKVKFGFDLAGGICALLAVFFALLFTFFIGVTATLEVNSSSSSIAMTASQTNTIWRYFGSGYTQLAELLEGMDEYSGYFEISLYFPLILGTVVSCATILLTVTFSIVAAVKYGLHFKNPENGYAKYAVMAVFSYLAGVLMVYAIDSGAITSLAELENPITVSLSSTTIAGVVLSAVFLGLYFLCKIVALGKRLLQKRTIVELACAAAGIVFATIAVTFACRYSVKLSVITRASSSWSSSATTTKITAGLNSAAANALLATLYEGCELEEGLAGAYFVNLIAQVLQLLTLVFGAIALVQCVNSCKEKHTSRLGIAITFFAISLVYLIFACVGAALSAQYANDALAESGSSSATTVKVAVSANVIVALVMSAIALASAIVQKVCRPQGSFILSSPAPQAPYDEQ